jgi:hypothetical protein
MAQLKEDDAISQSLQQHPDFHSISNDQRLKMTTITAGTVEVTIPPWTTSTNLGPLPTTAFPSDCLASLWDFNTPALGMPWTQMTQGCAASTCCPYGNFYTEAWAWMTSYYSPGVCPSQYRSCHGPMPPSALSTAPDETIAFCCPTSKLS